MNIEKHYNRTVSTKRLAADPDSSRKELYSTNLASVDCMIQPLDESFNQDLEGSFGKDYLMFCAVVDIKEGDLVIDGATTYRVTGFKSHTFLQEAHHMELRIREFNQ